MYEADAWNLCGMYEAVSVKSSVLLGQLHLVHTTRRDNIFWVAGTCMAHSTDLLQPAYGISLLLQSIMSCHTIEHNSPQRQHNIKSTRFTSAPREHPNQRGCQL
jgi:hypothetical protein